MIAALMIFAGTGAMLLIIALVASRGQVKELETKLESECRQAEAANRKAAELQNKLESHRQKREIDEAKRVELKQQLENALKEVEFQKVAVARLSQQIHDPREALALLTRIVENNEAEHA